MTGLPALLESPSRHQMLANSVAGMQGCERGVLARSSLHLIWDLFTLCGGCDHALYVDSAVYPTTRQGAELARNLGATLSFFDHHDTGSLARRLRRDAGERNRPLVVTDGYCPRCGRIAPIRQYLELIRKNGGRMIIDDTQAIGVLGSRSFELPAPYGRGGGGSLRWVGIHGPDVILVTSMAKAFGVPLAILSGSRAFIRQFKAKSHTRVHSSSPSAADVRAAEHALALNDRIGDSLRRRLSRLVQLFRSLMKQIGLRLVDGHFPIQLLSQDLKVDPVHLHISLKRMGVKTVLLREERPHPAQLAFVISAEHRADEIRQAVRAVAHCLPHASYSKAKEIDNDWLFVLPEPCPPGTGRSAGCR